MGYTRVMGQLSDRSCGSWVTRYDPLSAVRLLSSLPVVEQWKVRRCRHSAGKQLMMVVDARCDLDLTGDDVRCNMTAVSRYHHNSSSSTALTSTHIHAAPKMYHQRPFATNLAQALCWFCPLSRCWQNTAQHLCVNIQSEFVEACRGQCTNKRNPRTYQIAFYKTLSGSINAQVS